MRLGHLSGNDLQEATPSMQELLEVSETINKKFMVSDHVDGMIVNHLSRQEMLEVSQNISLYYAPRIISGKQGLTALAVDPQHLYIYWNIDGQSFNSLAQNLLDNDVVLKVYANSDALNQPVKKMLIEKTLHDFQSQQFVSLPNRVSQQDYSVSIEILNENKQFEVLLETNYILTQPVTIQNISNVEEGILNRQKIQPGVESFLKKHYASHNRSGQN